MPSAAHLVLMSALAASSASVSASAANAEDRYGPPQQDPVSFQASALTVGFLSWPAKTAAFKAAPPAAVTPPQAPVETLYRPARTEPVAGARLPASIYAPYPSIQPPPAAGAQPYARTAAAATAGPAADSAHSSQPPRFYSVHREFGLTPDPIPLPQQFFADSAATDMAAPPPPLAPHPVPGSQAANAAANTPANRTRALELGDGGDAQSN
jgi:hypothetical protein